MKNEDNKNIDNPSCFFDFSFLKRKYDYKFIIDNQHIFYRMTKFCLIYMVM